MGYAKWTKSFEPSIIYKYRGKSGVNNHFGSCDIAALYQKLSYNEACNNEVRLYMCRYIPFHIISLVTEKY